MFITRFLGCFLYGNHNCRFMRLVSMVRTSHKPGGRDYAELMPESIGVWIGIVVVEGKLKRFERCSKGEMDRNWC